MVSTAEVEMRNRPKKHDLARLQKSKKILEII